MVVNILIFHFIKSIIEGDQSHFILRKNSFFIIISDTVKDKTSFFVIRWMIQCLFLKSWTLWNFRKIFDGLRVLSKNYPTTIVSSLLKTSLSLSSIIIWCHLLTTIRYLYVAALAASALPVMYHWRALLNKHSFITHCVNNTALVLYLNDTHLFYKGKTCCD